MLATTPITGTAALVQLARLLRKWLMSGQIKNEEGTKILILSGSHGTRAGLSVLSDIELADYTLYTRDCSKVGFGADEEITDVNAERKERLTLQESFINLEEFNKMTFQVVNWLRILLCKQIHGVSGISTQCFLRIGSLMYICVSIFTTSLATPYLCVGFLIFIFFT